MLFLSKGLSRRTISESVEMALGDEIWVVGCGQSGLERLNEDGERNLRTGSVGARVDTSFFIFDFGNFFTRGSFDFTLTRPRLVLLWELRGFRFNNTYFFPSNPLCHLFLLPFLRPSLYGRASKTQLHYYQDKRMNFTSFTTQSVWSHVERLLTFKTK